MDRTHTMPGLEDLRAVASQILIDLVDLPVLPSSFVQPSFLVDGVCVKKTQNILKHNVDAQTTDAVCIT